MAAFAFRSLIVVSTSTSAAPAAGGIGPSYSVPDAVSVVDALAVDVGVERLQAELVDQRQHPVLGRADPLAADLDDLAVADARGSGSGRRPGRGPRARRPSGRRWRTSRAALSPARPAPTTIDVALALRGGARSARRPATRPAAIPAAPARAPPIAPRRLIPRCSRAHPRASERPARRGRARSDQPPSSPSVSRARYSSASSGLSPARSTTLSRSDIVATSSTCSLMNHCMNCSPW